MEEKVPGDTQYDSFNREEKLDYDDKEEVEMSSGRR